jgi:hypothetical protein
MPRKYILPRPGSPDAGIIAEMARISGAAVGLAPCQSGANCLAEWAIMKAFPEM